MAARESMAWRPRRLGKVDGLALSGGMYPANYS